MNQITHFFGRAESDFNYLRYIKITWEWWKVIKKEVENLRKKDLVSSEQIFIMVDTNINSADYETTSIMENFFNGIFPNYYKTNKNINSQFNSNNHMVKKYNFIHKFFIWYFESRYLGPFPNFLILMKKLFPAEKIPIKTNPDFAFNRLIRMFSKAHDTSFP